MTVSSVALVTVTVKVSTIPGVTEPTGNRRYGKRCPICCITLSGQSDAVSVWHAHACVSTVSGLSGSELSPG